MKKFTKEKGITLIALVITIIVMLILVAVTVSVALNGGLFSKANDAARKTQIEIDREELQAALLDTMDDNGGLHLGNIATHLDTDDTDGEYWEAYGSKFTRHHKNGDANQFTVTISTNGGFTVTYDEGGTTVASEVPEDLVKYILGAEETGRSVLDILDIQNMSFLDDTSTTSINESTAVTMLGQPLVANQIGGFMYIRYNNDGNTYKIRILATNVSDPTTIVTAPISSSEKIAILSIQDENVGKTATINGEKYIVLYGAGEKGPNVQLISANAYGSVKLGGQDDQIDWEDSDIIAAANIFSETGSSTVLSGHEKAIYSYNHAIETLNAKCAEIVGNSNSDILDVRSVGSNPTNKNSENSTPYTSTFLQNNPTSATYYSAGEANGVAKGRDMNMVDDFERLGLLEVLVPENSRTYWLASRAINDDNSDTGFLIMDISGGQITIEQLFKVNSYSFYNESASYAVRPVISISPSNLAKYLD